MSALHFFDQRLLLLLQSLADLLSSLEVCLGLLQVLSQDFLFLASVCLGYLEFQLKPLAVLGQLSLLELFRRELLIVGLLHFGKLLLKLLLQVINLLGGLLFANDGLTLRALDRL